MMRTLKRSGIVAAGWLFTAQADAADATHGAMVFQGCAICHSNTRGAGAKIAQPVRRHRPHSRTFPEFSYSAAMKKAGFVWTTRKVTAYA